MAANQIENDGSIWAFKEGDTVEIETIPGDGYHVESFTVKDSSSGDIVAEKEKLKHRKFIRITDFQ